MSKLRLQSLKENKVSHSEKDEIRIEVARDLRKKKERCPLCGSYEWIGEIESYVLHHVCKRCGFESKELVGN